MSNKEKYINLKNKLTCKYEKEISVINNILDTIEKYSDIDKDDSFITIVFKKYLELENVSEVAKYLNDNGYRIKTDSYIGQRKYIGRDVTEILISEDVDLVVDKQLKDTVQYLQDKNYSEMLKHWG